ncbi:MAG: glycosyltransferase family 2 protein, partial [Elusimicrobiota bacterium]|nr:glycosyltransferase family 2 protein [Elusimicrobiota bacterium]
IGLSVLVYTYLGYPIVLWIVTRILPLKETCPGRVFPHVTMIIAAYNEAKVIAAKIENCLELDYPAIKLNFIVVSDGSSDATNPIVSGIAAAESRVRLLALPRGGKATAINAAMKEAGGEIVVFSDANTLYEPSALGKLVRHFADTSTGCVCGRLSYQNPGAVLSGRGESAYWRYETALKKMESRLGYVAGANGAIYAIRKDLFEPLPAGTINDDFFISMRIVLRGFKCLYDAEAVAYEEVAPDVKSEFRRHVRDGAGHYIAVRQLIGLLNPLLGLRAFIYWSHRILRWAAPFILIGVFAANAAISVRQPYSALFFIQTAFYLAALTGYFISHSRKAPFIVYVPFYFCNLNLALLLGFIRVLRGSAKPTWESTQRV